MSYQSQEESRHSGEPVDLFLFRYGSAANAYYAYTDGEQEITYDSIVYRPISMMRANITSSGTLDKATLEITLPINTEVADLFRIYPPTQVINLTIRQGHLSDESQEFLVAWSGRVLSCDREGSEATLACEPISTSMRRSGLRRHYQLSCPHVLYGSICKANKANATITRPIITVAASKLTFDDGWSGAINPKKYIGGMVEWDTATGTESRTILRIADLKTLTLSGPTTGLVAGTNVNLILGCNHKFVMSDSGADASKTDCIGLHNNIVNFGGQPFIPLKNPVRTNPFR